MAFRVSGALGQVPARPAGIGVCSVSAAIGAVAGSFFSEKYSETPFEVTNSSFAA